MVKALLAGVSPRSSVLRQRSVLNVISYDGTLNKILVIHIYLNGSPFFNFNNNIGQHVLSKVFEIYKKMPRYIKHSYFVIITQFNSFLALHQHSRFSDGKSKLLLAERGLSWNLSSTLSRDDRSVIERVLRHEAYHLVLE